MVSRAVIGQRLHQTATSWREICQLLNTWIPFADSDQIDFTPYPLSALLAVSRKLDLPLATLVPEIAALTGQETVAETATAATELTDGHMSDVMCEVDMTEFDVAETGTEATGPGLDIPAWESSSLDHRSMTVLTALAHAACPLGATEIAQALGVALAQVTEALEHLLRHPQLAGPLRLRPVPPDLYELKARVDLLDSDQLLMLKTMDVARDGMTVIEATALRAAIDHCHHFSLTSITDFLNKNREVADRLVCRGYLQPPALTDAYIIDPDVINSLRIPINREYERVRSPQRSDPAYEEFASDEANAFPLRHVSYEPVSSGTRQPPSDSDHDSSLSAPLGQDTPP
jgi:hypothetical protein